ncbi:MAG TPA: hypothetical protein VIK53_10720 [Verrucomicrobiae bacterium]
MSKPFFTTKAPRHKENEKLGVFVSWWLRMFAWFAYFAVHLIRPPATFSPSDAEKELFFDSSPSPCSLSLLLVWRGEGEAFVKKSVLGIETNPFPPSSDFRHRQSFAVTSA